MLNLRKITGRLIALAFLLSSLGFVVTTGTDKVSAKQFCERCYDTGGQIQYCTWTAPAFCPPQGTPPPPNASCQFVDQCPVS